MSSPAASVCCESRFLKSFLNSAAVLLLIILSYNSRLTAQSKPLAVAESCAKFGDAFNDSNDLSALQQYRSQLRGLLEREDFKQLDCIADSMRTNKSRFPGGK